MSEESIPSIKKTGSRRAGAAFEAVVVVMERLRAPGGCPWDRAQTFDSIRPYTIEETYEVLEAIADRDWSGLRDELGDLLLQVVFYSEMAREENRFDITDVLEGLSSKLVRRHPHVFEDESGARMSPEQALGRWESMKAAEKPRPEKRSLMDGVPRDLPALAAAAKLGRKAAGVGFDWPEVAGIWQKLDEELEELRRAVGSGPREHAEEELGDVLFTLVNLARHLELEPEAALQRATRKFSKRFRGMEQSAESRGTELRRLSPEAWDELWRSVKQGTEEPGPGGGAQ